MLGEYELSLIVTDGFDWSIPDTVRITVIENQVPVAVVTAQPTAGSVPLTVEFDGTASHDPEGGALHYQWSFGDGSLPVEGPAVTHTYDSIGVYDTVLTVIDDFELIDSDSVAITVTVPPAVPSIHPIALYTLLPSLLIVAGLLALRLRS